MPSFYESIIEKATLDWLCDLGYTILHGADIAPGIRSAERADYGQVLLVGRLSSVLLPGLIYGQLCVPDAAHLI